MGPARYVLGHLASEIHRLELQARMLDPPTRHVLDRIGVGAGMRVLDIGTGAGDVAALLAEYVGPTGHVVAYDRSPDAIARARARFGHIGQIDFQLRSSRDEDEPGSYDLVIGRFVACFQKDEPAFLRQAASLVAPGGTIAFIEPAFSRKWTTSSPEVALYDRTFEWVAKAFRAGGARVDLGNRCVRWFKLAGLPEPSLLKEVLVGGPSSSCCEWLALLLVSLAPALESAGLAKVADFDLETLRFRLEDAVDAADSQVIGPPAVGAWAKVG